MDPSIVSALSAVLGSLVGGSATIATAWVTQKTQSRRELAAAEIRKRELLYTEFIDECSKLAIDALDHTLDDHHKGFSRLRASESYQAHIVRRGGCRRRSDHKAYPQELFRAPEVEPGVFEALGRHARSFDGFAHDYAPQFA